MAICSGLFSVPFIPDIPGIEHVPQVMHSSEVKKRSQLGVHNQVLILGDGDSALEMAYLAVTADTNSVIIAQHGVRTTLPKVCKVLVGMLPQYSVRFVPNIEV